MHAFRRFDDRTKQPSAPGNNTDRLLSKEGSLLAWYSLDISTQQELTPQLSTADVQISMQNAASSEVDRHIFSWSPWHSERLQSARLSYVEELGRNDYRRRAPGPDRESAMKPDDPHKSAGGKRLAAAWYQEPGRSACRVPGQAINCSADTAKEHLNVRQLAKKPPSSVQGSAIAQVPLWLWYAVMLLSMGVAFISFLDRAILSVTILPMAAELDFSETMEGFISAAFFYGYTISNVAAGYLIMEYTAKSVLGAGVWIWSIFTILTPAAARSSHWAILLTRFLMGLGEGVTFPALQSIVTHWVQEHQRSRAISFIFSGCTLGTITAYASAPFIAERWGWEYVFLLCGLAGFGWVLLWAVLVVDKPQQALDTSPPAGEGEDGPVRIPWLGFATCLPLWAIIVIETSHGVGQWMAFFWQPSYYVQVYGKTLEEASFLSILPWAASAVCTNLAGWAADALINSERMSLTAVRKLMANLASLGPACFLLLLAFGMGRSALGAMGLFAGLLSWSGCHAAGAGSQHLDINPRYAAIMYGFTNGLSSTLEAVGIAATGIVLDRTKSWALMFELVASLHVLGGLFYALFADSRARFGDAKHARDAEQ